MVNKNSSLLLCKTLLYKVLFDLLQYYFNASTNQFMYWDGEKSTYLPAPTDGAQPTQGVEKKEDEKKKQEKDKKEKVKVAKKIAKVMF